jgi:outer membrane autotransporter protein
MDKFMNKKDKKNKNLIKKFLVASAVASGLVGVSESALGVSYTTTGNVITSTNNGNGITAPVVDGDTIVFGGNTNTITVDQNLSTVGLKLDLNNLDLVGNGGKVIIGNNGVNDGKLRLNATDILNHAGITGKNAGARLKIDFGKVSTNALENQLILSGDFSAGQIHSIDFTNKANASAVLLDGVKLNLENILSTGAANGSVLNAKANFDLTTKAFGHGNAISSFNLFTETAGSTGKITFDTAAGAGMNAANPIKFLNNGNLVLKSTSATNSVTFTGDLDIDSKKATITFTGGGALYKGFDMGNMIKKADNANFVVDMNDANAVVYINAATKATFLDKDTAQDLTIKKGTIDVNKDTKFKSVTFEGSLKPADGTLALAGDGDHTIKLDTKNPKNTGVLEVFGVTAGLDKNSTVFTKDSTGIYELYFSKDVAPLNFDNAAVLTLTKESSNIDTLYITSKNDNEGTLKLVGGATLGSTKTDSYIGYYPGADEKIAVDPTRIKGIDLTTTEDKQEIVFTQKKIRIGKFENAAANDVGLTADHAGKSSNWTFSASDIRTHFNVKTADSAVKVNLNNQDDAGVTLAGTWGSDANKISEFVIETKGDVKLDDSTDTPAVALGLAMGGNGQTYIKTKKLTFNTDVNVIASEGVVFADAYFGDNKGGIIFASSTTAYDPDNAGTTGTSISKDYVKKLVDGKVARLGVNGEVDTIATDAEKANAPAIRVADLEDLDASTLKLVTLKSTKGKAIIEGRAKLGDIGAAETLFESVTFSGTKDATYTSNVFADNVYFSAPVAAVPAVPAAPKDSASLVFTGDINNTKEIDIKNNKKITFSGNVGNIKASAAELLFNGKDKNIGDLGATATPIEKKVSFVDGSANIGNINVKTLNAKDYEFKISGGKTIHTAEASTEENVTYTFNDSNSSLTLTASGADAAHKYSKTLTLNLKRANETSQSRIILKDLSHINSDSLNSIVINLDAGYDDGVDADVTSSKSIRFIETPEGVETKRLEEKLNQTVKLKVKNSNRFQGYERNGLFIVSKIVSVKDAIDNIYNDLIDAKIDKADAENVKDYIGSFNIIGPNSQFAIFLQKISKNNDTESKNIVALVKNTQGVAKDTYSVISSTASITSQIADSLGNRMAAVSAISASGDENPISSVGAYLQPFMSFANNSSDGNKYDLSGGGFTIGGDVGLNENNTVLGLAYTFASNKLKLKDSATSGTTNASTNAFSIYATQKVSSEAFVEGLFAYASTDVRANKSKITGIDAKTELTYKDTKDNYNVKTMIGRGLIGYSYNIDSFVISPLVGAEFISSKTDGFKEKDSAVNTSISSKNTLNPAVLFGARFATEIESDDMRIVPTAGLLMKFKLSDKDMEINQTLDGIKGSYTYKNSKVSKFSVSPSVGVTVKQNQMEYSASYAADISTKYLGHNAGLKVKINF